MNLFTTNAVRDTVRDAATPVSAAVIETLEDRRLKSVSYNAATDVLSVYGTGGNDTIEVQEYRQTNYGLGIGNTLSVSYSNHLKVNDNGNVHVYNEADVDEVRIYLYGGNDVVDLDDTAANWQQALRTFDTKMTVYGYDGNDDVTTGEADDYVSLGGGNDRAYTGGGNDTVYGSSGEDSIYTYAGNDYVSAGNDDDYVSTSSGNDTVYGGSGDDYITTSTDNDQVIADAGDDTVYTSSGDDSVWAGDGDDYVSASSGNDYLGGGNGHDTVYASSGNDSVWGDNGNDVIYGSSGSDQLQGGNGDDHIDAGNDNDTVWGQDGEDSLHGGSGNDQLHGGDDDDDLYGDAGNDSLYGNNGNDGMYGGSGADRLEGGADDDRYLDRSWTTTSTTGWWLWEETHTHRHYEDTHVGKTAGDATIPFESTSAQTGLRFNGFDDTFNAAAGVFSDAEIKLIDSALGAMHRATDSDTLMEKSGGDLMIFRRVGTITNASTGAVSSIAAWNGGGVMQYGDGTFNGSDDWARQVVLHEVGHNWDTEWDASGWNVLSGWVRSSGPISGFTASSGSGDDWYYQNGSQFVRSYGRWNPLEDFATSFANWFMNLEGWDYAGNGTDISLIANKNNFMTNMVNAM